RHESLVVDESEPTVEGGRARVVDPHVEADVADAAFSTYRCDCMHQRTPDAGPASGRRNVQIRDVEEPGQLARDRREDESGDTGVVLGDEGETVADMFAQVFPGVLPVLAQEGRNVELVLHREPEVVQDVVVLVSRRADGHEGR